MLSPPGRRGSSPATESAVSSTGCPHRSRGRHRHAANRRAHGCPRSGAVTSRLRRSLAAWRVRHCCSTGPRTPGSYHESSRPLRCRAGCRFGSIRHFRYHRLPSARATEQARRTTASNRAADVRVACASHRVSPVSSTWDGERILALEPIVYDPDAVPVVLHALRGVSTTPFDQMTVGPSIPYLTESPTLSREPGGDASGSARSFDQGTFR